MWIMAHRADDETLVTLQIPEEPKIKGEVVLVIKLLSSITFRLFLLGGNKDGGNKDGGRQAAGCRSGLSLFF